VVADKKVLQLSFTLLVAQADIWRVHRLTAVGGEKHAYIVDTVDSSYGILNFLGATRTSYASDSPTAILVASNSMVSGEIGVFFIKIVSIEGDATTAAMILRVRAYSA
jgi:hypothetical protein